MFRRHYLTGVLVLLSIAAGSAVASAAETGTKTVPDSSIHAIAYRYDHAGPRAGYGCYDDRWDSNTWSTGNGYY